MPVSPQALGRVMDVTAGGSQLDVLWASFEQEHLQSSQTDQAGDEKRERRAGGAKGGTEEKTTPNSGRTDSCLPATRRGSRTMSWAESEMGSRGC